MSGVPVVPHTHHLGPATDAARAEIPVPHSGFQGETMSAESNATAWREAVATLFDVDELARRQINPFRADFDSYAIGPVLFQRARASGQRFRRTLETIARGGMDHLIIQVYLRGDLAGIAGDRPVHAQAGDVCCFDLAGTLETRVTTFESLTLVVPRPLLEMHLPRVDALHGFVLSRASVMASLLRRHFMALIEEAPRIANADCQAVADGATALVAACLRGELERREAGPGATGTLLRDRVRQHIETRLGDPSLSADAVAAHFALSRSSLYRLFAPLGGVAEYIRNRRLHRAFLDLTVPGARVSEVARRWNFGSEASFTRSFKLAYGIPPRAAREAAVAGETSWTGSARVLRSPS